MANQRLQDQSDILEADEAAIAAAEAAHGKTGDALDAARKRLAADKAAIHALIEQLYPDEPTVLSLVSVPGEKAPAA